MSLDYLYKQQFVFLFRFNQNEAFFEPLLAYWIEKVSISQKVLILPDPLPHVASVFDHRGPCSAHKMLLSLLPILEKDSVEGWGFNFIRLRVFEGQIIIFNLGSILDGLKQERSYLFFIDLVPDFHLFLKALHEPTDELWGDFIEAKMDDSDIQGSPFDSDQAEPPFGTSVTWHLEYLKECVVIESECCENPYDT